MTDRGGLSRRAFLIGAGGIALAACNDGSASPPTSDGAATEPDDVLATTDTEATALVVSTTEPEGTAATASSAPAAAPSALTSTDFDGLAVCALLPESAAGPFPTIEQLERRDVTEGYPGHPLRLGVRVVDAECRPVPDADVEIWHADATGDYSSYTDGGSGKDEGDGSTFLRGFQTTDADGIAEFQSIYPGWYEGRAVHIHTRVRLDDDLLLTSQLYFDEAYSADVYTAAPYAEFGPPDTTWASDGLVGDPATDGTGIVLAGAPTTSGQGTLGLVNMGVRV